MADLDAMETPLAYDDALIRRILSTVKTIAAVGLSADQMRPSFFAASYLKGKGYRILPVNPRYVGGTILGERVYPSLEALETVPDMVQIFRRPSDVPPIVESAIKLGVKIVWMQLGIRHDDAARLAEQAGLEVVMDRCPKIEYGRLFGEIGWIGVNRRTISAKKGQAMQLKRVRPPLLPRRSVP